MRASQTPLHQAAWNGKMEAARALLDAGGDVRIVNVSGVWMMEEDCVWNCDFI